MKKRAGDWLSGFVGDADFATVIPVSGTVDKARYAELKSGSAKRAADTWGELRRGAGALLDTCGEHVMVVPVVRQPREWTVVFPMKRLEQSCTELAGLADVYGWVKVFMPPEFAELSKIDKATVNSILDERFVVMYDPKALEEKLARRAAPKPKFKRVAKRG